MKNELDDFAISLATGESRRDAVKRLLLGAFGALGLAGLVGAESLVEAKRRKKAKRKQGQLKRKGKGKKKKKGKKRRKHQTPVSPPPSPPASPPVACTPAANPCGARVCGTVDDGCGTQVPCGANGSACGADETCTDDGQCVCDDAICPEGYQCGTFANSCGNVSGPCGTNNGDCPPVECNSEATCGADGQCTYAIADFEIGSPCQNDTGVCVKNADGSGTCEITNDGTQTCVGADPCGEVNEPRQCASSNPWGDGDCGCYSTVEQGGLCLRRTSSMTYPSSAIGCFDTDTRPPCDTSAECDAGWVCVPLDALGTGGDICCGNRGDNDGKRGACVHVATDLCDAPQP